MKKLNKFLALGLAGASALTGGFMLSGCDITQDSDKTQNEQTQEQTKVVTSLVINNSTLPSYIIRGHFARTNITMTATYEDGSTAVLDVTESMFNDTDKAKLKNIGQYNLTVNHGGKTATIYANVVDERYLLKEIVEANLDKDVSITYDDEIMKVDWENKVTYYSDNDGYVSWLWLNNNICYNYETGEGIDKSLASDFDDWSRDDYMMSVFDILNGVDEDGVAWTIEGIEKDGLNYILTATQGGDCQYKYYFNEDFMYKVEEIDGGHTYISNYNYSILNLEVPADIKALESSATVDVENSIDDLKWGVIESYLESDFEMNIFDASIGDIFGTTRYDADKNIFYIEDVERFTEWNWVSGQNYYSKENDRDIQKFDLSGWKGWVEECMFGEIDFYSEECSANISEDGQYYELIISFEEDGDNDVWEYKYIFNNEEIARIDVKCDGQHMGYYTYNKTNVVLEVPAEIKALESSAQ
ncbi:MAG: hypothetical protein ACLRFE_02370 [Clostridia bacterium]